MAPRLQQLPPTLGALDWSSDAEKALLAEETAERAAEAARQGGKKKKKKGKAAAAAPDTTAMPLPCVAAAPPSPPDEAVAVDTAEVAHCWWTNICCWSISLTEADVDHDISTSGKMLAADRNAMLASLSDGNCQSSIEKLKWNLAALERLPTFDSQASLERFSTFESQVSFESQASPVDIDDSVHVHEWPVCEPTTPMDD